MRFKAILTTDGVSLLEQRFLPAFERIGRVCHVYLTPSDVFLLHNVLSADGVQAIAQFPTGELFSEHLISSASADRIAFSLDLSLLARALRSSLATAATRHQLKLVKKSTNPTAPALPFLSLEAKGERSSIVQDIPISTPLPRSQLNELQAGIDLVHSLPETLVQLPDLPSLRHLVERLQSVGDVADVATMRSGALAMRTHTPSITVAAQFKNLKVFGANSGNLSAISVHFNQVAMRTHTPSITVAAQFKNLKVFGANSGNLLAISVHFNQVAKHTHTPSITVTTQFKNLKVFGANSGDL
ncbi:unnamed protein product [Closterium sp. NIES-53]